MNKCNKINHKTLFLLDLTANFTSKSCEQPIEFDIFSKNRTPSLPAICKSLWTCTVEAVLEYSRIAWDLFPENDKLISFIAFKESDCVQLNNWPDQSLSYVSNSFAQLLPTNKPSSKSSRNDSALINSITDCLEQFARFSPLQLELNKKNKDINNCGRLILISNFQNNNQINNFIKQLDSNLNQFNKAINSKDSNEKSKLPINKLHLVIINTYPVNQDTTKVTELELHNVSESNNLSCEIFNCKSGTFISLKMITLLLNHYDLASTTVTGIPMKEEQNASSSANYDVEIVHSSDAHLDLIKNALTSDQILKANRDDVTYESVSLKWCTPKGSQVELHQCSGAYRITAVEINSRPSSCLINFLLSGRTVMLEIPKLKGKCMSHMLSSHSGELFIHTLGFNKSIVDDPPSISECAGGRVTDYRITDFAELIRSMRLERCKPSSTGELPLEKSKEYLAKQTLYWPLTIGHSIIFNLTNLQPLLKLIPKAELNADEVNDCQTCLYQLVKMETKNQSLPVPSILPKSKNIKKDDLYKLLWKELEYFIEQHSTTSEHNKVLSCLRELNTKFDTSKENQQNTSTIPKKFSALIDENEHLAWKEFDRFNAMSEREKNDFNNSNQVTSDLSMPDLKRQKLNDNQMNKIIKKSLMNGSLSLYGLNCKRLEIENTLKKEFKGRIECRKNGTNFISLYSNLTPKPENPL